MLSHLLLREESQGRLLGIKLGRDDLRINHMLFVDDLINFAKSSVREVSVMEECLDKSMLWSGQKINKKKSSVHFSKKFLEPKVYCPFLIFFS